MGETGFKTSEGKSSLGSVIGIVGTVLGAVIVLPPEQVQLLREFLPIVIWPIAVIVSAYTLSRSIVKYAERRDAPAIRPNTPIIEGDK